MDAIFQCRCGQVQGRIKDAGPQTALRIVCYCLDCQAYLHELGREDLFEPGSGTDVVQFRPSVVTITEGHAQLRGLRLSEKGLFRWHTACCNTPIANTPGPNLPHFGMLTSVAARDADRASVAGKIEGSFRPECASARIKTPPKIGPRVLAVAIGRVLGWRLTGKGWPHPFFERRSGQPTYPIRVLTEAERNRLRPLCGPQRA